MRFNPIQFMDFKSMLEMLLEGNFTDKTEGERKREILAQNKNVLTVGPTGLWITFPKINSESLITRLVKIKH